MDATADGKREPFHWRTAIAYKTKDKIVVRGYDLNELTGGISFAEMAYLVWRGELPSPAHGRMLDAILVSMAEHAFSPSSAASRLITSGGVPLHVVVDGQGEPAVLLLAGLGEPWFDWDPTVPLLAGRHRVVRYDRPGLGASPARRTYPTLAEEADRIAAVIDRYGLDRPVVVAHSAAALPAEACARRHPGGLSGLVLVDPKQVEAMLHASAASLEAPEPAARQVTLEELAPQITYDEFAKVDLRVATVLQAEAVEGADKLLRLRVDIGSEQRTIFAGIRQSYRPEDLIGKQVIVVANLQPRKMRFGVSEGMLLAAGPDSTDVVVAEFGQSRQPGERVR